MTFSKQEILPEIIGIIDIGSYKVRVAITKYQNKEIELIGYGEKRQDFSNNCNGEIKGLLNHISDAIKKAEKNGNITIKNIALNITFEEVFFEVNKINYIRKDTSKSIDKIELYNILKEIKQKSLDKAYLNIKNNYSYDKNQLKLVMCNINNILIDNIKTKKLIKTNPNGINFNILNIFIPEKKYNFIKMMSTKLDKEIIKIIPTEYSIAKLDYNNKDVVIIDLGSCHTSVIINKNNNIVGIKKIALGIRELIIKICKQYGITRTIVINDIDNPDLYIKEKINFLNIFKDVIIVALEEILGDKECPNNFFMIGGGSNKFIKKFVKNINFENYGINIKNKITFITPNIEYLDDIDSSKSNLNIFSMINATRYFIKKQKDEIEDTLKEIEI